MNGSDVLLEGILLLRFCYIHWMVALSLRKVVRWWDFVTPMDGSLVIMEGSMFSIFLLLQWMVALSLWKVIFYRDFCYSNGW